MKRNIVLTVCCAMMILVLSGCQLAKEYTFLYEDRLIGVFITTGSIDHGPLAERNRIFARQVTKTLTSEDTGETSETEEFIFEQTVGNPLAGIPFFMPTVTGTAEYGSYTTTMTDEAISNGNISINAGDDFNSKTMEGTIYVTPSNEIIVYSFNPVYQGTDGGVYVTSGDSISMSGMTSAGASMSKTLDAVTTITENGVTTTDSFSVSITISILPAPDKIVFLQMDTGNSLVLRSEYDPDAIVETLTPDADTAYIIVETHKRDESGSLIISREIYDRDTESIGNFVARPDGICVMHWTQLVW